MVGHHQNIRVDIGKTQELTNLAIDLLVIVVNRALQFVARLVESMCRIHVVPHGVMDTVGAHLHHDEVIPVILG